MVIIVKKTQCRKITENEKLNTKLYPNNEIKIQKIETDEKQNKQSF